MPFLAPVQALFAPVVLAIVVGATTAHLTSGDSDYVRLKLQHDCYHLMTGMWSFWAGGMVASYLLVPTPWQPPFAFGLQVVWSAFVAFKLHRPMLGRATKSEEEARLVGYLRDRRDVQSK